ncbi:MAG: hypothetical protein FIA96_02290 [Betaproteobacteria bacterium]|nr:hypothetical protein [Betaproteobacteria bacterium]
MLLTETETAGFRCLQSELSGKPFRTEAGDPADLAREIEAQHRANRASLDAALAEKRSRMVKAKQDLSAADEQKHHR